MLLKRWDNLPENMKTEQVKPYYDIISKKRISLFFKRVTDIILALLMIIVFSIPMFVIALVIVLDSKGGVFYRQERITTYGKVFRIHKFRTMVADADRIGSQVTVGKDNRITRF